MTTDSRAAARAEAKVARMTPGRWYVAVVFYLAAAILAWRAGQFATVSVLQSIHTGYGIVWAFLSIQFILAGLAATVYFALLGRASGRRDFAAAGTALVAATVAGVAWLTMDFALL